MPEVTALNGTNSDDVLLAMTLASVVLPEPGGPQRTSEVKRSSSIKRRSIFPFASRWSCPTTSSSARGRIRSASGVIEDTLSEGANIPNCLRDFADCPSNSGNRLDPFSLVGICQSIGSKWVKLSRFRYCPQSETNKSGAFDGNWPGA